MALPYAPQQPLARSSLSPSSTRLSVPDNSTERFDLISFEGVSLGSSKARTLVHRDGDWHRSVHIWLLDERGRLLLQRRASRKDSFPSHWDVSCAGHLSEGEDSLRAAFSELEEELGISPERLFFLCTLPRSVISQEGAFRDNEVTDVYYCLLEGGKEPVFVLQESEVEAVQWLEVEEYLSILEHFEEGVPPASFLSSAASSSSSFGSSSFPVRSYFVSSSPSSPSTGEKYVPIPDLRNYKEKVFFPLIQLRDERRKERGEREKLQKEDQNQEQKQKQKPSPSSSSSSSSSLSSSCSPAAPSRIPGPSRLLLSLHFSNIYSEDYNLLAPNCWLNDNLINIYFDLLQYELFPAAADSSSSPFRFVSPMTSHLLASEEDEEDFADLFQGCEFPSSPAAFLFFPINNKSNPLSSGGSHWSLLVFETSSFSFFSFDSIAKSNSRLAQKLAQKVHAFLQREGKKSKANSKLVYSDFPSPQQSNNSDCGLYVLANAREIARYYLSAGSSVSPPSSLLQTENFKKNLHSAVSRAVPTLRTEIRNEIYKRIPQNTKI